MTPFLEEPVLVVLLASGLAAAVSALGAIPFTAERARPRLVGGAQALASGLMLGAGYILMTGALDLGEIAALIGAGLGVLYTFFVQTYAGTSELDDGDPVTESEDPLLGYKVLLQSVLHSASEGIAIGVAMLVDLRLGIFVAAALALHNVAEGIALSDVLDRLGMSRSECAALCVVTDVGQPLLALAVFALAPVLEGRLAAPLGFAAGCLVFLVLTELLPDAYDKAHKGAIATGVTLSAGLVVLMEDLFR